MTQPESAEDFHYAVVGCACGFAPSDGVSDGAACHDLLAHISEHVVAKECEQCGGPIVQPTSKRGRKPRFCSRTCQLAALAEQPQRQYGALKSRGIR